MLPGGCGWAVLWCAYMLCRVGPKAAALCYLWLLEASGAEDDCI